MQSLYETIIIIVMPRHNLYNKVTIHLSWHFSPFKSWHNKFKSKMYDSLVATTFYLTLSIANKFNDKKICILFSIYFKKIVFTSLCTLLTLQLLHKQKIWIDSQEKSTLLCLGPFIRGRHRSNATRAKNLQTKCINIGVFWVDDRSDALARVSPAYFEFQAVIVSRVNPKIRLDKNRCAFL